MGRILRTHKLFTALSAVNVPLFADGYTTADAVVVLGHGGG
jgi:hypothetical protein